MRGRYNIGGHFSHVTRTGPAENEEEDGFWGYVYEFYVKLPDDDKNPDHWAPSREVDKSGTVTILYDGKPFFVKKEQIGPDGPTIHAQDWTHSGFLYVVDTPDIQKVARDPKGNLQKVISGDIVIAFSFNVKNTRNPRRSCAASLILVLSITDGNPVWSVFFKQVL